MSPTSRGVWVLLMQVSSVKAPNEASNTLGVQNSHAYSMRGNERGVPVAVMLKCDHIVYALPATKHIAPMTILFRMLQSMWKRM